MDNYIFKPSSRFSKQEEKDTTTEYYTIVGSEEFVDDQGYPKIANESKNTFAKKTTRKNGSMKYSIRLNNSGKLSNPTSVYGQEKDQTFLDKVCRSNDRFKEVNQKVFDLYMNFLKTKNIAYLNNAERENQ